MTRNLLLSAGALILALVCIAAMPATNQQPSAQAPIYNISFKPADGNAVTLQAVAGSPVRVHRNGKLLAIQTRFFKDTMMVVRLFGGDCGAGEVQTMKISSLKKLKEGRVSIGGSLSHRFPRGGSVDVTLTPQMGPTVEGSQGCACTVTCPDGTTITACKVRSSCGNCG